MLGNVLFFSEIVIYRPKKFQSKFEDKEVAFDGDVKEYKVKAWLEDTR